MRRVVGPRRLATALETHIRRQNGKTPTPSTRELAASTEAPSPSIFLFGAETAISNHPIPSDDGQHPPAAFNFATAAASRHAHAKRSSKTPATAQPRWSTSTASRHSLRTRGSMLPLLDFVDVLRAQLPVRQGTAALPKLRHRPREVLQHGCRPQRSHPRGQSRQSPTFRFGEIS